MAWGSSVREQLDFLFPTFARSQSEEDFLQLSSSAVPLRFLRNESARRYILRIGEDGSARVTIPRRGSFKAARQFVARHLGWIEKQLQKRNMQPTVPSVWTLGTEVLFRGNPVRIEGQPDEHRIQLGDQLICIAQPFGDLRPAIERHLRKLAAVELVPRTWELATRHQVLIQQVSVRSQRSRWGSCSGKKTISLNWRLIQTPAFVSDYIILHELMHLREMNHSRRFWRQVEQVCPDYLQAEAWLKQNGRLLK